MAAEEIRNKIHAAYQQAVSNHSVQKLYSSSSTANLFRDLKLYGHEAGVDFVKTQSGQLIKDAVEAAECKSPMLELPAYGCGHAALKGMADALAEITGLKVELQGNTLKLISADTSPRLI